MLADMTFFDFLSQHWAGVLIVLGGIGTAISGATAWLAKVVWARLETSWTKREEREDRMAFKTDQLIDTLREQVPKQTTLLESMAAMGTEARRYDSDMMREVHQTKQAATELSYGLEALAGEDAQKRRQEVERYMKRARERLGVQPKEQ